MKRRDVLAATGLAAAAPWAMQNTAAQAAEAKGGRQWLELRLYRMKSAEKKAAFLDHLAKAAIPAWNRLGIKPVGVFGVTEPAKKNLQELTENDLYVLLPHASAESVATADCKLGEDKVYLEAGKAVQEAPKKDPAYDRIDSSLLLAFPSMPAVETPAKSKTRLFQLRIYESHNLVKARGKIHMFDKGGELPLFRKTGMTPVFFGEALAGDLVPNLTYMLGFETPEAKDLAWKAFLRHPEWKRISRLPEYKDTVSRISNIMLAPAACSQI